MSGGQSCQLLKRDQQLPAWWGVRSKRVSLSLAVPEAKLHAFQANVGTAERTVAALGIGISANTCWLNTSCFEAMVNDLRSVLRVAREWQSQPSTVILDRSDFTIDL